jgi:hypothetical protein
VSLSLWGDVIRAEFAPARRTRLKVRVCSIFCPASSPTRPGGIPRNSIIDKGRGKTISVSRFPR